jgi:hypothetical protein
MRARHATWPTGSGLGCVKTVLLVVRAEDKCERRRPRMKDSLRPQVRGALKRVAAVAAAGNDVRHWEASVRTSKPARVAPSETPGCRSPSVRAVPADHPRLTGPSRAPRARLWVATSYLAPFRWIPINTFRRCDPNTEGLVGTPGRAEPVAVRRVKATMLHEFHAESWAQRARDRVEVSFLVPA